jgi:hypothetical protein
MQLTDKHKKFLLNYTLNYHNHYPNIMYEFVEENLENGFDYENLEEAIKEFLEEVNTEH